MDDTDSGRTHGPAEGFAGATGWRARVRRRPGGALLLKGGTLLLGLACVAVGVALVPLPGPLTIPPVLLGLYILAAEFVWADRLLDRAKASADEAWQSARRRPVASAVMTGGGLVLAAVAVWAVLRYDILQRGQDLVSP